MSVTGLPAGVTVSLSSLSVSAGGASFLSVVTSPSVLPGDTVDGHGNDIVGLAYRNVRVDGQGFVDVVGGRRIFRVGVVAHDGQNRGGRSVGYPSVDVVDGRRSRADRFVECRVRLPASPQRSTIRRQMVVQRSCGSARVRQSLQVRRHSRLRAPALTSIR